MNGGFFSVETSETSSMNFGILLCVQAAETAFLGISILSLFEFARCGVTLALSVCIGSLAQSLWPYRSVNSLEYADVYRSSLVCRLWQTTAILYCIATQISQCCSGEIMTGFGSVCAGRFEGLHKKGLLS